MPQLSPCCVVYPADSLLFGLPLLLGDRGIWLATPLAEMLTTLFILVIYISGKKEHKEKSVSLDKMGCTPT